MSETRSKSVLDGIFQRDKPTRRKNRTIHADIDNWDRLQKECQLRGVSVSRVVDHLIEGLLEEIDRRAEGGK